MSPKETSLFDKIENGILYQMKIGELFIETGSSKFSLDETDKTINLSIVRDKINELYLLMKHDDLVINLKAMIVFEEIQEGKYYWLRYGGNRGLWHPDGRDIDEKDRYFELTEDKWNEYLDKFINELGDLLKKEWKGKFTIDPWFYTKKYIVSISFPNIKYLWHNREHHEQICYDSIEKLKEKI
jgi:hypothetical protein